MCAIEVNLWVTIPYSAIQCWFYKSGHSAAFWLLWGSAAGGARWSHRTGSGGRRLSFNFIPKVVPSAFFIPAGLFFLYRSWILFNLITSRTRPNTLPHGHGSSELMFFFSRDLDPRPMGHFPQGQNSPTHISQLLPPFQRFHRSFLIFSASSFLSPTLKDGSLFLQLLHYWYLGVLFLYLHLFG